mmetsp:Transcript_29309/g.62819  ORF Transcript_29309/g.62819 Transcript_29309/m.62819 type:complete len:202 (-) Transcript_29309:108-713(-)
MRNIKSVTGRVESTAKRIASVPQKIGHSILSVSDNIFDKKAREQQSRKEERDEETTNELHEAVCSNIIEDQNGRNAVRESHEECMREIIEHLNLYIFTISDSNPGSIARYEYKNWIEALHPDNVNYLRSGRSIIDHRFYMEDSHHRKLWNDYMVKLDCRDSIVRAESRDPRNIMNPTLVDTLVAGTDDLCGSMGNPCSVFP